MSGPSQPCECQPRIHPFLLETFQRAKRSPVLEDGKICTNCVYGNGTTPTSCVCENPPFSVSAKCALNVLGSQNPGPMALQSTCPTGTMKSAVWAKNVARVRAFAIVHVQSLERNRNIQDSDRPSWSLPMGKKQGLTFLHITSCPTDYCQWNTNTLLCEDRQGLWKAFDISHHCFIPCLERSLDVSTVYWRSTSSGLGCCPEIYF